MQIAGLQGWEWLIIIFVILLLFGGRKIPELARNLGRAMGEFKRGREEIEKELREGAKGETKPEGSIVKAARELGIDTEGKTEEELKKEIAEKMKK
jgi:sec-independent protein translocase protein TatA